MANEVKFETGVDLRNQRGINSADPVAATDVVNLQTLESYVRGITSTKESVRVATTTAGTLATDFANGSTVDGVTLATGDRILLKNQVAGADNGIRVVQASGTPTRSADADTSAKVLEGMTVFVGAGTVNGDTTWQLITNNPIILNTTALVFAQIGAATIYTAGAGLTESPAKTINVANADGTLTVSADDVKVTPGVVARIASTATHGSSTSIAFTHGLNTQAVTWSVKIVSTNEYIYPGAVETDVNTLTFTFGNAPSSNTLRFTATG